MTPILLLSPDAFIHHDRPLEFSSVVVWCSCSHISFRDVIGLHRVRMSEFA